jgi:hypothetical protein
MKLIVFLNKSLIFHFEWSNNIIRFICFLFNLFINFFEILKSYLYIKYLQLFLLSHLTTFQLEKLNQHLKANNNANHQAFSLIINIFSLRPFSQ